MAYDDGNVFARILRGELPAHTVYEDEHTLAFMDIMPRADGHTLVIPKAKAVNIFDIEDESLSHLIRTVRKLAPAVRDAMGAGGILIQQFNETAAGQVVFHIHFHILPRWEDVKLRPPSGEMADPKELADNCAKIRAALKAAERAA